MPEASFPPGRVIILRDDEATISKKAAPVSFWFNVEPEAAQNSAHD